jgi:hypothetical protein
VVNEFAYIGSLSLGQCIPLALTATAGMSLGLSAAMPQLQGKFVGLTKVALSLSVKVPGLQELIVAAGKTAQQLQALLSTPGPTGGISLTAVTGLASQLSTQIDSLKQQVDVAAGFSTLLGTPGIEAYRYEGGASGFVSAASPEFSNGLRVGGGPNLPIYAIVLVATDGGAAQAMKSVLVG